MKIFARHILKSVLGTLAIAVALAGVQAKAENIPQVIQVVTVKGKARYATDSKTWHTLRQGEVLPPGVVIQTGPESSVDIQLSDKDAPVNYGGGSVSAAVVGPNALVAPPSSSGSGAGFGAAPQANVVRIFANSVLSIDKLTVDRTSAEEVSETQLDLQAGKIMGNVKKLSASSKYEIKIPNGVAGIRGSAYSIDTTALFQMLSGSGILALVGADGNVKTWMVSAGQGFNPVEQAIFQIAVADLQLLLQVLQHIGFPIGGGGPPFTPPYCPPPFTPVR